MIENLKSKLGPLPIWAWGVIVGVAGLLGYYLFNRNKDIKSTANTVTPDVYAGADSGLGLAYPSGQVTSVISDGVETNQSWIAKSVRYLSEQGYNSADAQAWLQSYVSGIPIVGARAKAAVQEALDRFGTAPDTSAGIPTFVPDPAEPSTPTTTNGRTLTKRTLYYVPKNNAWGILGPNGYVQQTDSQATANAWAKELGMTSIYVEPDEFQKIFDANKAK